MLTSRSAFQRDAPPRSSSFVRRRSRTCASPNDHPIDRRATTRGKENDVSTFHDLGVPADLVAALRRRDVTEPFPVQAATIPDALRGADVCGKAPTGSGKTLAFGIPLVARVRSARPRRPRALVLAPTRELAAQIHKDLEPLAAVRGARVCTVYGGVGYEKQKKALRRGVEILVACPGRLRDLIEQQAVRLDAVDIVVIDEADRMADMGFLPEVRRLLDATSPERQTILFSASLDGDVAVLQRAYQRDDAVTHEVAGAAEVADIEHTFEELDASKRVARAAELVRAHGSTIVFTRTPRRCRCGGDPWWALAGQARPCARRLQERQG
jgi:superfamily II DNA/RNA helicase